jgi:hypothetical protein
MSAENCTTHSVRFLKVDICKHCTIWNHIRFIVIWYISMCYRNLVADIEEY